jgi:hypothetical protein
VSSADLVSSCNALFYGSTWQRPLLTPRVAQIKAGSHHCVDWAWLLLQIVLNGAAPVFCQSLDTGPSC